MSHPSLAELPSYLSSFALNTLGVFNILYASLLTVLYGLLTLFTRNQSLRAFNSLYESLVFLTGL